jgi:membrane-associated protease RseP (regulator of RpoE activity)
VTVIAKESGARPPVDEAPWVTDAPAGGNAGPVLRLLGVLALIIVVFLVAGLGDLLLFIAILFAIVMLHELGHFATAKWSGMKVTEYFVGFGPRLWSIRRGETEYGVKAIPAGGYVRITGFTVLEDVAKEDEPRAYRQQPFWKRIVVASAGSAMHFLIALVLALIIVFAFGVPSNNAQVVGLDRWVGVTQNPAQAAGLKAGDTIVSVNGEALKSPDTLTHEIARSSGQPVTIGVERAGAVHDVTITPQDGRGVVIAGTHGETLAPSTARHAKGFIGIKLEQATESVGPVRAIGNAFDRVGSATSAEVNGVIKTFSPSGLSSVLHQVTNSKAATEAADHPGNSVRPVSLVGIASLGVQAQQAGLQSLLELLILINVIFGLLNMLPMLPLDGGHAAVAVYEWIRTKKGQVYYKADITKLFPVVFVFLAILAVFVFSGVYLDFTHPLQNPFGP